VTLAVVPVIEPAVFAGGGSSEHLGEAVRDPLGHELSLTDIANRAKTISTMENVTVDFAEDTPLYQQVAAEIRRAIAEGEARPGERMPLAKDLATILGVNTNTVLRALRELRDEGMLEFRRGRGITVAGTPERGVVMARVKDLIVFARQQGYQPAEVIAMIEAVS
jgi:GntR family transcriptional regulator